MMVKRKVLDEVGFFSNEFFMYYEETELTFRIKRAGYNVISIPDSRIQHLEGKSFGYQKISENRIKCLEESRCKYYKLCSSSLVRKITSVIYCLNIFIRFVVFCLLLSFNKIAYYSLKMKYFCLASRKCWCFLYIHKYLWHVLCYLNFCLLEGLFDVLNIWVLFIV